MTFADAMLEPTVSGVRPVGEANSGLTSPDILVQFDLYLK